jgi:hypothetical protein
MNQCSESPNGDHVFYGNESRCHYCQCVPHVFTTPQRKPSMTIDELKVQMLFIGVESWIKQARALYSERDFEGAIYSLGVIARDLRLLEDELSFNSPQRCL